MKNLTLILIYLCVFSTLKSIAQKATPCGCCTENHRQFDFWIGDWEVRDSTGNFLGTNKIELIQDSCVLQENWIGAQGLTGTSLSFYNRRTKLWHQTWVDKSGGVILMKGEPQQNKVVMLTDKFYPKEDNKSVYIQNKTTWYPLDDGRVHHIWEQTKDGGKTWNVVFDGYYQKK